MRYARVFTPPAASASAARARPGQLELGRLLVAELRELGLDDAELDENGYVFATLGADGRRRRADDRADRPRRHEPRRARARGRADRAPRLRRRRHRAAARRHRARPRADARAARAASGTTSSPPAGTPCSAPTTRRASRRSWPRSPTSPRTPSCRARRLRIAFTPDEEIGMGATLFDIERFGAIVRLHDRRLRASASCRTRRSRASEVVLVIEGVEVHPGFAYGKLVNAAAPRGARRRRAAADAHAGGDARPRGLHPRVLADRHRRARRGAARSCATSTTTCWPGTSRCCARIAEEVVATEPRARLHVHVSHQYPNMRPLPRRVPGRHGGRRRGDPRRGRSSRMRTADRAAGTDGSRLSARGPAHAEHLHRRPRVPLGARVGVGARDGGGRRHDRAPRRGVDARGVPRRPAGGALRIATGAI